jgi:hypothetical protein
MIQNYIRLCVHAELIHKCLILVRLWYDLVQSDRPMRVSSELLDGSARLTRPGMAADRASDL